MKKGCLYSIGGLAVFVLAIIIAWQIYCYYHFPPKGKKYIPIINPHPKYFLTVSGFIDPALKNKLTVTFQANYYTTNDACEAAFSAGDAFEGAYNYRQRNRSFTAKPDAHGKFTLKIPLDYYLPGFCQWQPMVVDYETAPLQFNGLVSYFSSTAKNIHSSSAYQEIYCKNSKNCRWGNRTVFPKKEPYYKKNYQYYLKIFKD